MVLLGGLEFVAAGYVLHELRKDGDKARVQSEDRRRRHRHDSHSHSHHRRDSDHRPRPPRPSGLAPPIVAPLRPNSAPPQQPFHPPQQNTGQPPPGPWMNQMPSQQHQSLPHPQTWPRPTGPNPTMAPNGNAQRPLFLASDFPPNPHQQQQQQPLPQMQTQPPPPGPGNLAHRPTMHLDLKTGMWQSDMLPPEMPRVNSEPVPTTRARSSSMQPPPPRLRQVQRRDSSTDSYSTDSDFSSDDDTALAYGSLPGERRRTRRAPSTLRQVVSRERPRPVPPVPMDRDGYGRWVGRTASMPAELAGSDPASGRDRAGTRPVEMPHQMRYELP